MGLYSVYLHSLNARQRAPVSRPQRSCCTRYWELRRTDCCSLPNCIRLLSFNRFVGNSFLSLKSFYSVFTLALHPQLLVL